MRFSQPLKIFTVHLVFMIALGGLGLVLVTRAFERYKESWTQSLATVPAEKLFRPLTSEVARSLLLKLEHGPSEPREQVRASVAEGLDKVLPTLPSIIRLVIVDDEQRVQYASETSGSSLSVSGERLTGLLGSDTPVREKVRLGSGQEVSRVVMPLFDDVSAEATGQTRRRLGAALVHYRSDARLARAFGELSGRRPDDADSIRVVENMLNPWISAVGSSLLAELKRDPADVEEDYQRSVSDGLNKLMGALPMDKLVIVDSERRIQYVNDPQYLDLIYNDEEYATLFASVDEVRESITLDSGEPGSRVMLPVFDQQDPSAGDPRRLGSVLIEFRPDPGLTARIPNLVPRAVAPRDYIQPLILFFVLAVGGGILLAALTGLPVRRMERVLADFRARGFKGGLDPKQLRVPADMASTVATISELGGRLEAMDEQGREREALLDTLSESLEDGMVAIDPQGVPVAWNRAVQRILHGDPNEPLDKQSPEKIGKALARNFDLRFAVDRVELSGTREVEIEQANGKRTLARVTQVPFEVRPGATGALLLIRDLAALRRVETHLLDAGRFAALAHLAAGLAHEIRNPLHAIQLNATVVEQYADRAGDDKRAHAVAESLTTIKEEAQRLTDLLNNYLGMVRPGAESGPVDLRELSRRVIQLVAYAARISHVQIGLSGDEHPPLVIGEANRLQQAILNLVLNAIQAMPDGGALTLHTDSYADMARITVSDTGPGLPQELADQLFDTRVTTKPDGSGLGLPLVRMIVEAHGGGVWYRSTPGEGASFTLVLPTHADGP